MKHYRYKKNLTTLDLQAPFIRLNQSLLTSSDVTLKSLTVSGAAGASLKLTDSGGGANDQTLEFDVDGGKLTIRSLNDDDTTRLDNILGIDLEFGYVGINQSAPVDKLHLSGGKIVIGAKSGELTTSANVTDGLRFSALPDTSEEWCPIQWWREFTDVVGAEIIAVRPGGTEAQTDILFKTSANSSNAVERARLTNGGFFVLGKGQWGTTVADGGTLQAPDLQTGGLGDVDGADLTIQAGLGTGVGDVGQIIFQTPRTAASGDNPQTRSTLLSLDGSTVVVSSGNLQCSQGTAIASASTLSPQLNGNYFDVTGSVTINLMETTGVQAGTMITLQFDAAVTVTYNATPSGSQKPFMLAGGVNFTAAAGDTLTIVYDGTYWREVARTVM